MVVDFVTNKVWTNLNGIGIASLWDLLTGPFPNSLKEILVLDSTGRVI